MDLIEAAAAVVAEAVGAADVADPHRKAAAALIDWLDAGTVRLRFDTGARVTVEVTDQETQVLDFRPGQDMTVHGVRTRPA